MALEVFANLAQTAVSAGGTAAPAPGTVEQWTVASPGLFPAVVTGANYFHVADVNPLYNSENIRVTAVSGSNWTVVRGAGGSAPAAHLPGFTVAQVLTAASLRQFQYRPWQFLPELYGARGDGVVCSDVTTNGTSTVTSATIGASGSAGQWVMIHGAKGATSGPLVAQITSISGNSITLSASATASVSNCPCVFGTDDTSAVNAALTAAGSYATANQYFAEVAFQDRIYVLASGPTQAASPAVQNSQLVLPSPAVNGTSQKLVIALAGAGDAGHCQYWESTTPNLAGTCLVSMTTAPSTKDATYGQQSVIGGPSGAAGLAGGYSNVKVSVRNLSVWCGIYTNQYAFDFGYVSAARAEKASAHIFAPTGVNGGVQPYLQSITASAFTSSIGVGFRFPVTGNNDDITADDINAEGYRYGYNLFDHFTASRVACIYAETVINVDLTLGASGTSHGIFIGLLSPEVFTNGIKTTAGSSNYLPLYVNMDAEYSGPAADVSDTGGVFRGIVRWTDPADTRAPAITGCSNLKIVNDKLSAGPWTGSMTPAVPAAPSSAANQQNTAYRDATVYLSATGGITVVQVGSLTSAMTTTGLTAGNNAVIAVRVPSGNYYNVTYSGTLTTTWQLD